MLPNNFVEGGSSADKCQQTYHGLNAFSEPETAAVRDFLLSRQDTIKYYNSLHSYSQVKYEFDLYRKFFVLSKM